ncbi:MAG: pyridoxamine 5'-phosphate oxidase family protein [Chloroflexi bacterium]|nr:pyridoxamine 5'-phosphate oxidase family protein [Chloroflexota bacterium]
MTTTITLGHTAVSVEQRQPQDCKQRPWELHLDDTIYIHGSPAAGMFRNTKSPAVCLTVTHVDGIVLARSLLHHSMNYRSAVVFGNAEKVEDPEEILVGLKTVTDNIVPGRWDDARGPNEADLKQTDVFKLEIADCSAKVRTGPPGDDEEDYELDIWAGVLPLSRVPGDLIPDPRLKDGVEVPDYLAL